MIADGGGGGSTTLYDSKKGLIFFFFLNFSHLGGGGGLPGLFAPIIIFCVVLVFYWSVGKKLFTNFV